jgi:phosphoribosylaminoimidazole (AIR) synthetase
MGIGMVVFCTPEKVAELLRQVPEQGHRSAIKQQGTARYH